MRRLKFFEQSRNAQDRFIAATRGAALPRPLLFRGTRPSVPWIWIAGALLGLGAFVVLLWRGHGDLEHTAALASPTILLAAAVSLAAALASGAFAAANLVEGRRLPFPRGHYLFPVGLVDATRDELRVRPLADLSTSPAGSLVRVACSDGHEQRFALPADVTLGDLERSIQRAKDQIRQAEAAGDSLALSALDPLAEPRYSNPLAPRTPHRKPRPRWRGLIVPLALLVGGSIGMIAGTVRNKHSERLLYTAARQLDTPEAYRAYLARGGKRSDVGQLLLPSAELRRVVDQNSLPALEEYARGQRDSVIRPAVDLHLRAALLRELEAATARGTMTALSEFGAAHADFGHLVQAELTTARRNLARSAAERFLATSAAQTEGLDRFVTGLGSYLARGGPEVFVRFQRVVPESVARADEIVQRDKYFAKVMLPSQYFDGERSLARERELFQELQERFSAAFPPDILTLVLADPLLPGQELPTESTRPTLYISHSTNMGRGIPNQKPNGTFVGIGFLFKARFVVPGNEPPLHMKYSVWRLPDLLRLRKGMLTIPQIYVNMGTEAFAGFEDRLLAWLFRDGQK